MEWSRRRLPLPVQLGASLGALLVSLVSAAGAQGAIDQAEQVADIRAGALGSSPDGLAVFGHRVIFRAANDEVGEEPWISDGSEQGTVPLEVAPGPASTVSGAFTPIGDRVVFLALGPDGDELYRTDGTPAGTMQLRDINPGPASSNPRGFLGLGNNAIFRATDGAGTEPWRTDGTAAGTARVADINPGPANGLDGFFFPVRFGSSILFRATTPTTGSELWRMSLDGGAVELVANVALPGSSQPLQITPIGARAVFTADDGVTGRELWSTTGAPGNAQLVRDFDGAASDSGIGGIEAFGNRAYFAVDGKDGNGIELWRSDGTPGGTGLVRDINPAGNSSPQHLTAAGDWLYFTAIDGTHGRELWRSDGVPGGTTEMVADINPAGSSPCGSPSITPLGAEVFLCASDGTTGNELWRTRGTPATTGAVADLNPGPIGSAPAGLTVHGDALLFSANDGTTGTELWALDTGRPDTIVDAGPAGGARIADRTPSFRLSSTALDLAGFECSDGGGPGSYGDCAARDGRADFPRLRDGAHTLFLRAVDVRSNADASPAQVALTVDATAPRVRVKGRKLKRSGARGVVRAKLVCERSEASGPCRGKLKLRTGKPKKLTLGGKRFRLEPGKAKAVRVKLKRRARRLVASTERTLRVRAGGRARDALGNSRKFGKRLKLKPR
jgi:ELWxxDGT repeat protein